MIQIAETGWSLIKKSYKTMFFVGFLFEETCAPFKSSRKLILNPNKVFFKIKLGKSYLLNVWNYCGFLL